MSVILEIIKASTLEMRRPLIWAIVPTIQKGVVTPAVVMVVMGVGIMEDEGKREVIEL